MKRFTWEEVIQITAEGGGRIYSLPFGEYQGTVFTKEKILLRAIPKDNYVTEKFCLKADMDEDLLIIRRLMKVYKSGSNVPPVILDSKGRVIDGSHRIGAQQGLGFIELEAFVEEKVS